jgi:GNAT superfamily N-acetyltransferase
MILRDWRDLPGEVLVPMYAAECLRWRQRLQWDSSAASHEVEHARVTWGLPGFVAEDADGRIRGMAYYLIEHDRIDIGGIVSDDDAATDVLLDGIITVARALDLTSVRTLTLDAAVALASSMRTRGFAVEPHLYLSRSLTAPAPPLFPRSIRLWNRLVEGPRPVSCDEPLDGWQSEDIEPAAALLSRSYDQIAGRLFAPNLAAGEWSRYVRNLVTHVGCGILNPGMTQVLRDGTEMRGLALITDIAPGVAHLVQLAVDPARRGQRLGEALMQRTCDRLRDGGYQTLTLLVAGTNAPARALYDRLDFRHDAMFLSATLDVRAARQSTGRPALATAS